jgi:hypothetical protein
MPPSRAAAFALSLSFAAAAAGPSFTADFSQTAELNLPLLDCVGSGHGSLALRADYREHLARVQRDIGFKHIRGHGLIDDDMSTYLGGAANLINLFSVFDFYLSVGLRPIFELSFMPAALAYDPTKTVMHYQGITSAFKAGPEGAGKWTQLMTDMFTGLEARYGVDEVRRWRVEVWNEPQQCGFFCARPNITEIDGYFELYNVTATAINAVDPLISVGGPATAQLKWVPDFIARTGGGKLMPAHFLSTHSYPTDYKGAAVTRTAWEDGIVAAAQAAAAAGLPLVMTEVSAGLGSQYDPPFAAAFIAHAAAAFLGVANVPTLSFWTFSDIFEEKGFQSETWINTFGIQTVGALTNAHKHAHAECARARTRARARRARAHALTYNRAVRATRHTEIRRPKASLPRLRDAGRASLDGRLRGRGRRRRAAAARQWPRCALHGNCRHGRRRHGRRRLAGHDRRAARACHKLQRER